ncbi:MAG TPA: sulfate transporter family protein [Xanthobacteraceae bacterium]|nr:sulfate transporter family protein [Xanthobacteraceae bacterium]
MLDAAFKALAQLFSRPFRTVLFKAIGLALVLLVAIGIGLQRLLAWLIGTGGAWVETNIGPTAHAPVNVLEWLLAIAAGLGIVAGAVFLMPAVTSLVAGFFGDEIAEQVERTHYPADPPGTPVPIARALIEGVKAAALTLLVYLVALPFLFVAGIGVFIFFFANAFLLGRIYFELAAMRFHPVAEAKRLRKARQGEVFIGGLFIAAFVSIPLLNLATPLFGTAFMVHLHQRLGGPRRELIERRA